MSLGSQTVRFLRRLKLKPTAISVAWKVISIYKCFAGVLSSDVCNYLPSKMKAPEFRHFN